MSSKPKDHHKDFDDEITEITDFAGLEGHPDVLNFSDMKERGQERRKHPRFNAAVTTIVYSANNSFRTKTSNLSEGGLRLTEELPQDFQNVGLEILLIEEKKDEPHQYYLFKARVLPSKTKHSRLEFTWVPHQTLKPFRGLLERLGQDTSRQAA